VFYQAKRSVVAVPSALTLTRGSRQGKLTILTRHEMPKLVVELENEDDEELEISENPRDNAPRFRTFLIRARTIAREGVKTVSLRVKEDPASKECLMVPVAIKGSAP
jgi:hypothetical protein